MKHLFILVIAWGISLPSMAQEASPNRQYQLISTSPGFVQYKNYYLLTLFQQLPELRKMLQNDPVLKEFFAHKMQLATEALKNCGFEVPCYSSALKFNDEEIQAVSNRLTKLFIAGNELDKLVKNHLIPSGCYGLYAHLSPKEMLIKAWEQDAKAINYTIGVYMNGDQPNYPKIDSISFNVKDRGYTELVATNLKLATTSQHTLFFEPSMAFAMEALELNDRKDAGDYEPMATTVNKAAIDRINQINWNNYPYSVILIPGEGPEDKETALSAGGMLRCRLAALQYTKGAAPFIVVSGGRVHPYKTKYSEAYEMKKFLINTLQIPEEAIIMEPHARHTTTNIRNCARLIFRYGIPMDKPAITSTLKSQSFYISDAVPERSKKELGYYPYKNGKRLSDTEMEFYPNTLSLQIDYDEPLDP
ncbi:YdcF family protein [Chitinophaga sp. 30R24]|uniref:YdcF family protein n=1 Tax=Chitinophaga sp. 30R24 TaxID=3248838 RepID=UPI003B91B95F